MSARQDFRWKGWLLPALALLLGGCDISVGQGGLSFGVGDGRASDVWERRYDLSPDGRFELVNITGPIEVTGTDGQQVEVRAERVVKAGSDETARDLLGKIDMSEDSSPTRVRIETRPPPRAMGWTHEVHYIVRVPRALELEVQTTNGGLSINGMGGRVRAVTTNGGISGRELTGALDATTTNGGIRVEFAGIVSQEIALETVNGGVELRVPGETKANVRARCTNGGISVSDLAFDPVGETSRRRLEGRLNGGGPARIDIATTNGGISLTGRR